MNKTIKDAVLDIFWNNIARKIIRPRYIGRIRKQYNYDKAISILSSNCIGGEIYNDLGLQFTSPTINLWLSEADFLKMMGHLKEYLSEELTFVNNGGGYPLAELKDIQIHFLHYSSEVEAKEKWYSRCKRINYDNIYMIMCDLDLTDDEFLSFQSITTVKRKIMFTTNPERAKYKDVFLIKGYQPYTYVRKYAVNRLNGFRDFERFFDFTAWLNGDDNFMI